MRVEFPPWRKTLNEHFVPLIDNMDRYLICYGGRGSSKSVFAAKKLIWRCLAEPYFRYILVRNTYATIKDSSYQTIKDIVYEWGLEELFEFKLQPLEIHCANGNYFVARGCDDTQKLKSIKDPTGVWYEEDIPTESDFITITSSIRTQKAKYLQEIFTINPEVEGHYQDNWFWKKFFEGKPIAKSYRSTSNLKYNIGGKIEEVNLSYTVHHSSYKHNRFIGKEFIAMLLDLKKTNPYYYDIYCLGNWGNKQLGGRFYKSFDINKHVFANKYNEMLPLHLSFDFNVNPHMSVSIWQVDGNDIRLVDEIAGFDPDNDTESVCLEFIRRYTNHRMGVYIYGDPSGKKEDTRSEKGFNDYTIIIDKLYTYEPELRVGKAAPSVEGRGKFINAIFDNGFDGLNISISEKSVYLKNDLLFGKQAPDGSKLKEKGKVNDIPGVEKYHHFSDTMDYFICECFPDSYIRYQNRDMANYKRLTGYKQYRNDKRIT